MVASPAPQTRRIVARSALRQASALVQEWQADAENNARWARRLSAVFAVAALVGQVEAMLDGIDAQHALQIDGPAAANTT